MKTKIILATLVALLLLANIAIAVDPSTSATATVNVIAKTCGLSATNLHFNDIFPGETSEVENSTVTNNGNSNTTSLYIKGGDWHSGINTMEVEQTKWSLSYMSGFSSLFNYIYGENTGTNVANGASKTFYFKLIVPETQLSGNYSQTITFISGC
jgi:hypothetical protein